MKILWTAYYLKYLIIKIKLIRKLTAGISKKLVTIFARYLDSFIMTPNLSSVYQFRIPGFAKIAPWRLASRDKLLAKVPGLVTGWTAPPTLSAHTRNR
jgi:hypothetical protein